MEETIFKIQKMDCPSEENMIRMKLDENDHVRNLVFNIPERKLTVFHKGGLEQIESQLQQLNLSSSRLSTQETTEEIQESVGAEKKFLWIVLGLNFSFFVIEMAFGWISASMGLIADSLDMLADSVVYGLSLIAVGGSLLKKKKIARLAGYFQIILAIIGFAEVLRRFFGEEILPDFTTMIVVSLLALIANSISLFILNKAGSSGAHMKASMIFTSNDIIINTGVIIAGLLVNWLRTGLPDMIIGAIVFIIVIQGAVRILKLGK